MRFGVPSLVFLMLLSTAGAAQTINGESTYEDNFIHSPPADAPAQRNSDRPEARFTTGAAPQTPRADENR